MGIKEIRTGTCSICGDYGPLSYEHVPPKSAFNDRPIRLGKIRENDDHLKEGDIRGALLRRGLGFYSICERCNTRTGHWYGSQFSEFCHQGARGYHLICSGAAVAIPFVIQPLNTIKQIVTMFFSVNSSDFRVAQPYLQKFVLDKNTKFLPPEIRVHIYFNVYGRPRVSGVASTLNLPTRKIRVFSEIVFPPFGYVMSFNSEPPDARQRDISFFADFDYGVANPLQLVLPVLPTVGFMPGDYRSPAEIMNDRKINERSGQN